jgi:hypothetical protein
MKFYNIETKEMLYAGDIEMLKVDNPELLKNIVELEWVEIPISDTPNIGYVLGEMVCEDNVWKNTWTKVTHTESELKEIQQTIEELIKDSIDYLQKNK